MGNTAGKSNESQVRPINETGPRASGASKRESGQGGRMSWATMGASASTVMNNSEAQRTSDQTVGHITDRMDQVNLTTSLDDLVRSHNSNSGKNGQLKSRRRSQSIRITKGFQPKPKSQSPRNSLEPVSEPLKEEKSTVRVPQSRVNSCNTLFVDSTVVNQNLEQTIGRFGAVMWELVAHGHSLEDPVHDEVFDETIHHITNSSKTLDTSLIPDETVIFKFLKVLFQSAQLCAECAIIALIYVHRLTGMAGITLHASNWRRVALASIALASKVWDDQAVWNIDYCNILPMIKIDDMNTLERKFILFIQFNVSVEPSLYAKYYFDLRKLAIAEDFESSPLNETKARQMKISSSGMDQSDVKKRSKSAEFLSYKPRRAHLI